MTEEKKLKTLEDLNFGWGETVTLEDGKQAKVDKWDTFVSKEELRQVAIEWIKEIDSALEYSSEKYPPIPEKEKRTVAWIFEDLRHFKWTDLEGIRRWVIHFFNISEDDLK